MLGARDVAADLLLRLQASGGRVREALARVRDRLPEPRDRSLLTELAYGVPRQQHALDVVAGAFSRRPLEALDAAARVALRLALYQALYLDRVPAATAVDQAVGWTRRKAGPGASGYVNGVLRAVLRSVAGPALGPEDPRRDLPRGDGSAVRFVDPIFPDPVLAAAGNLAARYAMPTWLVERRLARWGPARTLAVLRAEGQRPGLTLRVRRGSADELRKELTALDPGVRLGPIDGSVLLPGGEGGGLGVVADGRAYVQDATAQRVAPLLEVEPGQRLLDLCAAPGGKALHLADLLGGRGAVVLCDVDARKVERLEALRPLVPAGVAWTAVRVDPEGPLPFEPASFDAILVDAPCSNTGVLRRRVEARTRLSLADVHQRAGVQRELLARALPLLKPGGRLVYSTCSVEPEENDDVVAAVAAAHPGLTRAGGFDVAPGPDADGGFAAVLVRPA
jgi:16S rRNA (cytosine967-C5)-methyltransferase